MARPKNELEKVLAKSLPIKSRLLLAVSGGKDSVALMHACLKLREKYKLRIGVAHVDHALRKTSKRDAEFVKKLAEKNNLEFYGVRIKKTSIKENIEAWGRRERYKFFDKILKNEKFDWILTAHTANDVAETFLMRLVSNKELYSIEECDKNRKLLRPFLKVSTEEVLNYLKSNKLKFVEDETNKEESFLRNRVRGKLLPMMSRLFDKRIAETLSERARGIQEDYIGLNSLFESDLLQIAKLEFGSKAWLRAVKSSLARTPDFLAWRLAERLIKPLLSFNLGRSKSKELVRLFKGEILAVQLPGAKSLRLKAGGIQIK